MNGQADAAGVGRFITLNDDREYADGIREVGREKGIPRAPILVSPELSDDEQSDVVDAFLNAPDSMYLGKDGEEDGDDEETPDDLWFSDVREASIDDFQPVIDVANELGVSTDLLDS
jgi:phosphonate transport system substrate-binding protein